MQHMLNMYHSDSKLPIVVGDDNFREMIDAYVKSHSLSVEIVGADRIKLPPSMNHIVSVVAAHYGILTEKIYRASHRVKNNARSVAIYVCRELGGYQLSEIAKTMGNVSYKSISTTIQRMKLKSDLIYISRVIISKIT